MRARCEIFVTYYLPAIRAIIAKKLIEKGLTQNEAAAKMHTTQPAISHYIREARGKRAKEIESDEKLAPKLEEIAERIYSQNLASEELEKLLCEVCKIIFGDMKC